jgi:hypothetical protein
MSIHVLGPNRLMTANHAQLMMPTIEEEVINNMLHHITNKIQKRASLDHNYCIVKISLKHRDKIKIILIEHGYRIQAHGCNAGEVRIEWS